MAIVTGLVGTTLFNRFLEGGALFMSLILICLLLSIYFIAKGFLTLSSNAEVSNKILKHINDCGVLGITLGFIGAFIGLIGAFDAIEASGGPVAPSILAVSKGIIALYHNHGRLFHATGDVHGVHEVPGAAGKAERIE